MHGIGGWRLLPLFCILSAFYPHQGNPSTTTVCLLFRCSDEPLIECSDIGGLDRDARWQNESDSLLAPIDATLSTCWLWCGQLLPIPTDQHPAICVAPTWKTVSPHRPLVSSCSCRLGLHIRSWCQGELLILYLVYVTPRLAWCNVTQYDPTSFIWSLYQLAELNNFKLKIL